MAIRYFDRRELADRYQSARPRVHDDVIRRAMELRAVDRVSTCLDVACGTGHSTAPLVDLADFVVGCDVSRHMLRRARGLLPGVPFVRCPAERLPVRDDAVDLLTVCMGFHWFDQQAFLDEVYRVLRPGGEMWVYNLWFPGELIGDSSFHDWFTERYLTRFPSPPRRGSALVDLLRESTVGLEHAGTHALDLRVEFSAAGLRSYFTTQSNVEAALRDGASMREIVGWLDAQLAEFFPAGRTREFVYSGFLEVAVA